MTRDAIPQDRELELQQAIVNRPDYVHEEVINAMTHGIGFVLSVIAGSYLSVVACVSGNWGIAAACIVYSLTLISVYGFSMLSHAVFDRPWRRFFKVMDQACIYLLITGTFTPFAVAYYSDSSWAVLLPLMWILAIFGFLSKTVFAHRIFRVSIPLYLALGWLPVIGIGRLVNLIQTGVVPPESLVWIGAGGLCYTLGTPFLYLDRREYYFHSIWHLLVIAGSTCHFYAILAFTVPKAVAA